MLRAACLTTGATTNGLEQEQSMTRRGALTCPSYNSLMPRSTSQAGGRSKRRQPRKGFPYRIVAYLDREAKQLLDSALRITGENTSMFTARALVDRAEKVLKEHKKEGLSE